MPKGKPLAGDRAAFDAQAWPGLHANDTDTAGGLHHTIGSGPGQAAAGSHTVDTDNPHSTTKAQVGLGNVANILCNLTATAAPTATDDSADGYAVGSSWIDVTNDKAYLCLDATEGAAVWQEVGGGGGTALTVEEVDGTPSVTNVNTINVTNGTLTDDGGGVITIDFGSAATDGAAIHDNVASEIHAITEKTTLAADDEFIIEDSAASYAKKRVKKSALGGGNPFLSPVFTVPVLSQFSWVNQGTATATEVTGGISLYDPANSATSYRILEKTTPSTPYTITAAFLSNLVLVNYMNIGLAWRDSVGGGIDAYQVIYNGGLQLRRLTASSNSADVQDTVLSLPLAIYHPFVYWRIQDDGTNRMYSFSADGQNFTQLHSVARTTYITPNRVGIIFSSRNANLPFYGTWLHWAEG